MNYSPEHDFFQVLHVIAMRVTIGVMRMSDPGAGENW